MGRLDEIASEQFTRWERLGRGWKVWPHPIAPEPPFRPFHGYFLPPVSPGADDGRKPGILATFFDRLHSGLNPNPPFSTKDENAEEDNAEPEIFERSSFIELQISLPSDFDAPKHSFKQFLQAVSMCDGPFCFELLGSSDHITTQLVVDREDLTLVREQLEAVFPDAVLTTREDALASAWNAGEESETAIVEFGLAREFMFPLAVCKRDPFVGITAALHELGKDELGLLQILFEPVRQPWGKSVLCALTDNDGKPLFQDAPELLKAAEQKVANALYGVVVRIATRGPGFDRAWDIARNLAAALRVFSNPIGNELIPLHNNDYPFDAHEEDVLLRQTRRSGMILTSDELLGFVHLPSAEVQSSKLVRQIVKTKAAPANVHVVSGLLLGFNSHAGRTVEIRLSPEQRVRHTHLLGASGTGKSTLLLNMISSDIASGQGVAVLDPHGDLIDHVLGNVPSERVNDVILFDATDEAYSIGFNILTAHSDLEKTLLASDLVSVFQRLSSSWGDQMASVMQNAILAFVESSRGGTLADLRRFLLDAEFRNEFLTTVDDADLIYYWRKGFPQLGGNKSIGPVLTRLENFLAPKPIRYIVSQQANRLDFADILDSGKVFLAKLSQGQIGKENAFLLGSLLMSKFQQTAMSRQAKAVAARRDFWLYLDECHHFITPSMTEILTGARKYRMGLTLAHQELRQLQRDTELSSAILSNCHTRIVFRVGDDDARKLAEGFANFAMRDLQNLDIGHAVCRVERSDGDFNLSVHPLAELNDTIVNERRQAIIAASRERYGTPRAEVEAMLAKQAETLPHGKRVIPTPPSLIAAPKPPTDVPQFSKAPLLPEVPKPTGSGKEKVAEPAKTEPHRDLGRGGAQHKAIQERIQAEAHALGFLAEIERQLTDRSMQAADILLRKGDLTIAVEVSVTTTVDHEFGNVKKCLALGFPHVAVVSPKAEHAKAIADAVRASLGGEVTDKVSFHTPDEFIVLMRKLGLDAAKPSKPEESVTRGYKIRRKGPSLSPAERRAKEDVAIRVVADAIKRRT